MPDLVGGQVSMFFAGMPPAMPHVQSGRLRALAVTTTRRSPTAPDVPTMEEAGVPGFDMSNWFAYFVPAGTPPDVIGQAQRRDQSRTQAAGRQGGSWRAWGLRQKAPPRGARPVPARESAKFAYLIKVSGTKGTDWAAKDSLRRSLFNPRRFQARASTITPATVSATPSSTRGPNLSSRRNSAESASVNSG